MSSYFIANTFESLFEIHRPEYNFALMDLSEVEPIFLKEYLLKNFEILQTKFQLQIRKEFFYEDLIEVENVYAALPLSEEKEKFISYLKFLISNFADVSISPIIGFSIEKIVTDMCKNFHCDKNSLRLVYTLLGPGTLWVENQNVNRENLELGGKNILIKDLNDIRQVPNSHLALLKGNSHPYGISNGVVHASPQIKNLKEKRILVRLESLY